VPVPVAPVPDEPVGAPLPVPGEPPATPALPAIDPHPAKPAPPTSTNAATASPTVRTRARLNSLVMQLRRPPPPRGSAFSPPAGDQRLNPALNTNPKRGAEPA